MFSWDDVLWIGDARADVAKLTSSHHDSTVTSPVLNLNEPVRFLLALVLQLLVAVNQVCLLYPMATTDLMSNRKTGVIGTKD